MIILTLVLSFYLEGIVSTYLNISFLVPLFSLMALIVVYPYMSYYEKKYYIICFITGLLYDIVYTNTLFLNASLFLLLGYIITKFHYYLQDNIININLISIVIIFIYRIFSYVLLVFINYIHNDYYELVFSILNSLLLNLLYISILYIITNKVLFKRGIYQEE